MYLLTEIALEMLGYKYYDTNGRPCATKFEKQNYSKYVYLDDEKNLRELLGITEEDDLKLTKVEQCDSTITDVVEVIDAEEQEETVEVTTAAAAAAPATRTSPSPKTPKIAVEQLEEAVASAAAIAKHAKCAINAIDKLVSSEIGRNSISTDTVKPKNAPKLKRKLNSMPEKAILDNAKQNTKRSYEEITSAVASNQENDVIIDDDQPSTSAAAARKLAVRSQQRNIKKPVATLAVDNQKPVVPNVASLKRNPLLQQIMGEMTNIQDDIKRNKVIFNERTDLMQQRERGAISNAELEKGYNVFQTEQLQKELENIINFREFVTEVLQIEQPELLKETKNNFEEQLANTKFGNEDGTICKADN